MKTIDELQAELRKICSELDKIKEAQQTETQQINFKELSSRTERYPIAGHPLKTADEYTKDMYLLILLSVADMESDKYEQSFTTIYRIAHGMEFKGNMETLFMSAKKMTFEKIDECTRLFLESDIKMILLLECMLLSAEFDKGRKKAMEYIAQLAILLNVGKRQIIFLSNLARVVLMQDLDEYKTDILNEYDVFDCYLDKFEKKFNIELIKAPKGQKLDKNKPDNFVTSFVYAETRNNKIYAVYNNLYWDFYMKLEIEIDIKNSIVDYIASSKYKTVSNGQDVIIGISSNHPLAHSKAIRQYKEAGGEI